MARLFIIEMKWTEEMEMTIDNDHYLRVNELKQYLYCPRTSYYALCLRLERETDLSKAGQVAEETTKKWMKRRKGALHAVHDGERYFDVALVSHVHEIVGRLDEMVVTEGGVYLVDYKDTDKDYGYWHVQMLAYNLMAQEMGYNVLGCYIYSIPKKAYQRSPSKHSTSRLSCAFGKLWRA